MAKESSKSTILVAIIGAIATIVAAVIGWMSHSAEPSAQNSGAHTTTITGDNNSTVTGNDNSTISNSPGATIGEVLSPFDTQNAVMIGTGYGTYIMGDPPSWMHKDNVAWFMIGFSNSSHRELKNVSFSMFTDKNLDEKPALYFTADAVNTHDYEQKKFIFDENRPLPQSVTLCVSFDGETPQQYINIVHYAVRRDSPPGHLPAAINYSYKFVGKYTIFTSDRPNDCARKGETHDVDLSKSRFYY